MTQNQRVNNTKHRRLGEDKSHADINALMINQD